MILMRHAAGIAALMSLAACGQTSQDGVGGVSASEASALNDAAAMLDARSGEARDPGVRDVNPAAVVAARADRRRVAASQDVPSHPR